MSAPAERDRSEAGTTTEPTAEDSRLRGRTYAIPFDRVWKSSVALVDGGLRGWRLVRADDRSGVLEAERRTLLRKEVDRIVVKIGLDPNAQTRLDVRCTREDVRGANATARRHPRIVDRFCRALDRKVEASPGQILDPTQPPPWSGGGTS